MDRLLAGETFEALQSTDGRFHFVYQGDGNLVLYGPTGPLWQSQTSGSRPGFAVLQGDGNLVVYDADERAVWASMTDGHPEASLVVQSDGNVVIYGAFDVPLWDTKTMYQETVDSVRPSEPAGPPPATAPPPVVGGGQLRVRRVTDEQDGTFVNRMYPYWSSACILGGDIYLFAGHVDGRPRFFKVDRTSGTVTRLGPQLDGFYTGDAEGLYWDASGWIYFIAGPRLHRVNPFTKEDRIVGDISESMPGCDLWQAHSSDDGQYHSATVRRIVSNGKYPYIGTVVFRPGGQDYFEAHGTLDESQITPDAGWLVIKEVRPGTEDSVDNRVINLRTRETQLLRDEDGAVGHSDVGAGFLVGEDNIHGQCVYWDLTQPLTPGRRRDLLPTWNLGHVSVAGRRCLRSDDTSLYLLDLNGNGQTHLLDHGMVGSGYDFQVMANLDPTGRVAAYMSNSGGGRLDVFVVELP